MLIEDIDRDIQVPVVFEIPWAVLAQEGRFSKGKDDHDRSNGFCTCLSRGRR